MQPIQAKPMDIGTILDRSFQLYRKNFVKLILILLLLYGPYYLLQNLILVNQATTETNNLLDRIKSGDSFNDIWAATTAIGETDPFGGIAQALIYLLVLLPIFFLFMMPISVASVTHLVKSHLQGEEIPSVGLLLRNAVKRIWPMAGSTFVAGLAMLGIYLGFVIVIVVGVILFSMGVGITEGIGGGMGPGLIIFAVIAGIALIVGFALGFAYFMIRWCYYLPFVALNEESIGIGRSWHVTKRSFWRLLLLYVVLSIVLYMISGVLSFLIALFSTGLFGQLLQSLLSVLIAPLWILPYVLSFFDLRMRNEGLGLEAMIQSTVYGGNPPAGLVEQRHNAADEPQHGQSSWTDRMESINLNKASAKEAPGSNELTEEPNKKDE